MNLSDLQIQAQVRTPWQALDLGVLMARRWFRPLWLAWLLPAMLMFLPLSLLFAEDPWIVSLTIWWLKPLFERLPLLLLSRFLFNECSLRGLTWRQLLSTWLFDCIPALLWRRPDPRRSFSLAVTVLERQKGRSRATRCRTLAYNGGSAAVWLTLVLAHVELLLMLAGPALVLMLAGDFIELDWLLLFSTEHGLLAHLSNAFSLLCMSLVAPFYVASGFALYINRRIELEAWDLELLFRQIAHERKGPARGPRGAGTAAMVLAAGLGLSLALAVWSGPVMAAPPAELAPAQSKEEMLVLLESPPFVIEQEQTRWRWKERDADTTESDHWQDDWLKGAGTGSFDGTGLFRAAEVLLWIGAGVLLMLLARVLVRHVRLSGAPSESVPEAGSPSVLMGMSIAADSLPADIHAAVAAALDRGDTRAALSLVYRYALHRLVHHYGVAVESWHTELECATAVKRHEGLGLGGEFDELTRAWLRLAYAHEQPSRAQVEQLLATLGRVLA